MKVYLIKNQDGNGYYTNNLQEIENIFEDAEVGETYSITLDEMTEEQYEALPEFDGF
jgi:hypothetical protein